MEQAILIYDGDCGLCGKIVGYLASRDIHGRFQLLPSQSQPGREALNVWGLPSGDPHTVVLIERDAVRVKSEAVLRAAVLLGGAWKMALFGKIIPGKIRDFFYDIIARNRYFLFGRGKACRLGECDTADCSNAIHGKEDVPTIKRNSTD